MPNCCFKENNFTEDGIVQAAWGSSDDDGTAWQGEAAGEGPDAVLLSDTWAAVAHEQPAQAQQPTGNPETNVEFISRCSNQSLHLCPADCKVCLSQGSAHWLAGDGVPLGSRGAGLATLRSVHPLPPQLLHEAAGKAHDDARAARAGGGAATAEAQHLDDVYQQAGAELAPR